MPRETGFPSQDAQDDFLRARRGPAARARRGLRREPGDVDLILPFEEVVARSAASASATSAAGRAARRDRRDRRPLLELRPRLPPRRRRARALGADRRGDAARCAMPSRCLPHRRAALRARGHHRVSVANAPGPGRGRRLRRRGRDAGRPAETLARVATWRSRTTSGCSSSASRCPPSARARDRGSPTRGGTATWPRPSRPGAFARSRRASTSWTARHGAAPGSPRSTRPSSTMLREAELIGRRETETDAYLRRRASATGSCAPTSGATRRSPGCGAGGRPYGRRTRLAHHPVAAHEPRGTPSRGGRRRWRGGCRRARG